MSQQGGRPSGHEDDWWRQLYDDSTDDTGPAPAPDSLDDRFASAAGAVGDGADQEADGERGDERRAFRPWKRGGRSGSAGAEPVVPAPRTGSAGAPDAHRPADGSAQRAPWEPPPARSPGPVTFPPATPPPGQSGQAPAPPQVPPPPEIPPSWPTTEDRPAQTEGSSRGSAFPDGESGTSASTTPADPPPTPPRPTDPPPAPPRPVDAPLLDRPEPRIEPPVPPAGRVRGHVGSRPPTYDAEPTALPPADPDDLDDLVADTVLDGARYGVCTLRAVSVRGDSARYRGEPRRDSLLTARFGTGEQALLLVAMATGARATPGAHRAAAEACHWIGRAVGRSHARLVADIRAGRRGDLKSGLHRLTDRSLGKLRASAAEQGVDPDEYAASLRCLLLSADPECRTRVFFGVGPGGLFRLREGEWQDIEPQVTEVKGEPVLGFGSPPPETPEGDRLTMDLGIPTPPSPYEPAPEPPREPFRFRTSVARPGDTLLMCSGGFADPLRGEPELGEYLADRWSRPEPPGLAAFLADSQVRVKGYADDRTAAAVWEA
ncbi:protein phosphatase 2C domain-containing protein [Streptomyces sp. NPDC006372]|uniref:protein phosphatase 2C domain-containing protein n=1 Tax=Streptomyces sp. NPDC006372 TaxID=3155599 RepID=UPI0033A6983D